jgi:hypothetical protein
MGCVQNVGNISHFNDNQEGTKSDTKVGIQYSHEYTTGYRLLAHELGRTTSKVKRTFSGISLV